VNQTTTNPVALAQLLRLASPMLPVGAYSYSQALEWAVEAGMVTDETTAFDWIADALRFNIGSLEAPGWCHLYRAWSARDPAAARAWNERFLATRETSELRAETLQMGGALAAVLASTREIDTTDLDAIEDPAFPTAFSFAAQRLGVPIRDGLVGYLWAWGENQVSGAMKLVPLGQSSGQRILTRLIALLPQITASALQADEASLSNFSPGLAIASCRHETQYTRLFRS
jgi:urease accessory protein